jgi:putative transposase
MGWSTESLRPHELTQFIDRSHPILSIVRQAELLGLDRQAYYYQSAVNEAEEARLKLHLNAIDEIYTERPYYGTRRMLYQLEKSYGIVIGRDRIRHLMVALGLEAVYPKPNTSKPGVGTGHQIYPYLLRNLTASYPNHIWGTDITYIRTATGFVYLVAFLDWHSRYVVSWALSDSLENSFVLAALREALQFVDNCGLALPDITNSDQGSNFTAQAYIDLLEQAGIQISMDGRGRCLDNIFTERLWRTVKYEEVFLQSYQDLDEAQAGLTKYFQFYNHERPHSSLDNQTPAAVYFGVRTEQ